MCIIVREIKPEDVEGVAEVTKTARMDDGEWIRSWIENPKEGEYIFVAEKDGKIISLTYIVLKQPPYGFIPTVATHSDYRRLGAATKTVGAALTKASESGFSIVSVFTTKDNIAAQGLYKKLGFIPAHPQWMACLINPLNIPLIDELKAKRPFLEPRLEESLVKIEGIDCACLKWYDVISKEQVTFYFNPLLSSFDLMKIDISSPSLKQNVSIQVHASNFNLCQDSEASVGITIENRSEDEFEYKLKVELPSCLTTEDKLDEINQKVAPKGKISHNINVLVPEDAQEGDAPIYFKVNDMPISPLLQIRDMIYFHLTPKILTLAPGESEQILIDLYGNHPETSGVEYELAYPADFSLESSKWKISDFKKRDRLLFQQSVTAPSEAKHGSYELTGKVTYRNHEFTSTIKLRVTDFPKILLLAKDNETEPLIDAILSEPANGLPWLTFQEVTNLNWYDTLKQYNLLILDEFYGRPRPLSFWEMSMVRDYVKSGGGFLMFGGRETCQGHDAEYCGLYKGTPIEEIVPVEFSSEWDTYETENFRVSKERTIEPFKLKCVDENHPITQGIDWESVPSINGYNKCASVKEKGKILIMNEKTNHSILVIGESGQGKVAVFLTCHGRGWAGGLKEWSGFNRLWNNLIQWLARK